MNETKTTNLIAHKVAREIARLLGEKHYGFIGHIRRVVRMCGEDFTREMYAATVEIEANGGMMLPDNSRRRTPGGVFLKLVRSKLDKDQWKKISYDSSKSRIVLLSWKKRIDLIQSLQTEQGQVKTLTVLLRGRPEQIDKGSEFVILTMFDTSSRGNLQAGIPLPPTTPTLFTIYVSLEQWEKVEAVITTSFEKLLIEGICVFDPETKSMPVFATSVQIEVVKAKPKKTADTPEKTKSNAVP